MASPVFEYQLLPCIVSPQFFFLLCFAFFVFFCFLGVFPSKYLCTMVSRILNVNKKYRILQQWMAKISATQKNIVTFSQIVFKFQYDRMKLSKVSSSLRLGNKLRVMAFQKNSSFKRQWGKF